MNLSALFDQRIGASIAAIESLRAQLPKLVQIAEEIIKRLQDGGTLYTAGNGGSAAHALHLAEELVGRYRGNRRPLRAVCLNADPTAITCIANDFGFKEIFARQCQALVRPGDVLVAFSTSGDSQNIVAALEAARANQATTIGVLGNQGGRCLALCDFAIVVGVEAGGDSAFVQDAHQVVLHLLCEAAERAFQPT